MGAARRGPPRAGAARRVGARLLAWRERAWLLGAVARGLEPQTGRPRAGLVLLLTRLSLASDR
eukprot:scaffold1464_cov39-Phaeocystis_antarctica.AAC.1